MDKTPLNRRENDFFIDTMILRNSLRKNADAVRERLSKTDGAWENVQQLNALVENVQNAMMSTIPDKKLARFQRIALEGRITVDYPNPTEIRGKYKLCDVDELTALTQAAMEGECAMCIKDGKEVRRCMLRNALLTIAPPTEVSSISCEYRDAAGALVSGRSFKL